MGKPSVIIIITAGEGRHGDILISEPQQVFCYFVYLQGPQGSDLNNDLFTNKSSGEYMNEHT